MNLENAISVIPDFPKPGIEFLDFSPILNDGEMFLQLNKELAQAVDSLEFTKIVAIESRGFILGSSLAAHLGKGLVMVRKKGKLPGKTRAFSYELEYGSDTLEILETSLASGDKVLIVDDVLATGGTAMACQKLVGECGANVVGSLFFIELDFLRGREKLSGPIFSLINKK